MRDPTHLGTLDLDRATRLLWQPIPEPYVPPPKPQDSWRTLKAGQLVSNLTSMDVEGKFHKPGTLWIVTSSTNMGVNFSSWLPYTIQGWLSGEEKPTKVLKKVPPEWLTGWGRGATIRSFQWTRDDWQGYFQRARQPKQADVVEMVRGLLGL